jgi:hypothetical protein
MKKSQLRNIIKESIQELLTEQTTAGPNCIIKVDLPSTTAAGGGCTIWCQTWEFTDLCCQNTNNQPFNVPSGFPWEPLGISGQTVACAPNCTSNGPVFNIPSSDIENILLQYSTANIISPGSPYPTIGPSGYWQGFWIDQSPQTTYQGCHNFITNPPPPPPPPPTPPNFGCAIQSAGNYDPNADGCQVGPMIADPNDASCCTPPNPAGNTNFGQLQPTGGFDKPIDVKTPSTPGPSFSPDGIEKITRMQDLANIKRKR